MADEESPTPPQDYSAEEYPDSEAVMDDVVGQSLTPDEHQQVKDVVNGAEMKRILRHERRYLVAGAGGTGAADRRQLVYDRLNRRTNPDAVAIQLEDFGLTREDIRLWTRVFDIFCGRATHIVVVIEDFDDGYVWEMGLLYSREYRSKVWILKRRYTDDQTERQKFDNGMAASHVEQLLTGPRCEEWVDESELKTAVEHVP
jgi:hypothetical protein